MATSDSKPEASILYLPFAPSGGLLVVVGLLFPEQNTCTCTCTFTCKLDTNEISVGYVLGGGICDGCTGIIRDSENMLMFGYCKNCLDLSSLCFGHLQKLNIS